MRGPLDPSLGVPIFFQFHAFLENFGNIVCDALLQGRRPQSRGNPGFATDVCEYLCQMKHKKFNVLEEMHQWKYSSTWKYFSFTMCQINVIELFISHRWIRSGDLEAKYNQLNCNVASKSKRHIKERHALWSQTCLSSLHAGEYVGQLPYSQTNKQSLPCVNVSEEISDIIRVDFLFLFSNTFQVLGSGHTERQR